VKLNPCKGLALFTDGSAYHKDRSGGWAWVAIDVYGAEEFASGYVADTTNNRMEMQAWIMGLTHLWDTYGSCSVLLYCDSQYVTYGAMDRSRSRKHNQDLWEEIDVLVDFHDYVEGIWVRGHDESHYNHLADELAGNARRNGIQD